MGEEERPAMRAGRLARGQVGGHVPPLAGGGGEQGAQDADHQARRRDARRDNQNRFKRRGQFWSKAGFASFIEAYVWYTNDELDVIYSQAA